MKKKIKKDFKRDWKTLQTFKNYLGFKKKINKKDLKKKIKK